MTELKTRPNHVDVSRFLATIPEHGKRSDSFEIAAMMQSLTGVEPRMWGTSIVGFGSYRYRYESGREGEWMLTGFSPRRQNLVIYIMNGFSSYGNIMNKIGKYKTGKSCLYVKSLADVDREVLRKLIESSLEDMRAKYETAS